MGSSCGYAPEVVDRYPGGDRRGAQGSRLNCVHEVNFDKQCSDVERRLTWFYGAGPGLPGNNPSESGV